MTGTTPRDEARRLYPNDEHLMKLIGEEQMLGSITMRLVGGGRDALNAEWRESVKLVAEAPANTLEGVIWKLCDIRNVLEACESPGETLMKQLEVAIEDLCAMVARKRKGRAGGAS